MTAVPVIAEASEATEILLLQAPYPGNLKFDGQPSSVLHAIAVYAHKLRWEGRLGELGWLDPGTPTAGYRERLQRLIRSPALRVLCISTTNAAIEEATWAARTARALGAQNLLVVLGGPHEDDVEEKAAARIPELDLSIGGDAEYVLDFVLSSFRQARGTRGGFVATLRAALLGLAVPGNRVTVTAKEWGTLELSLPPVRPSDLLPPVWTTKRVRFDIFRAAETLPVLLSRGCAYGKCTFCAEPNQAGARVVRESFEWLRDLVELRPGAAVYFQDSIFPRTRPVERELLPMLRQLGVEWGAQVYLGALSESWLRTLRDNGCRYLYTGIESASSDILGGIGKGKLTRDLVLQRLAAMSELGFNVGISLMFGAISLEGELLETEETIAETVALAHEILARGVKVTGFYPNVMTVLAGTEVERGLRRKGCRLDFYRMPRAQIFAPFEDGGVGYNFLTLPNPVRSRRAEDLAPRIAQAFEELSLPQSPQPRDSPPV